jgi:phosphoribosylanthranilate isomerase
MAPADAAAIASQLPGVAKVGVFVDQPLSEVREIADRCRLDYLQLHGHEPPDYCQALGRPVIKAFRYHPAFDAAVAASYPADLLLVDSLVPGQAGGSGQAFDWRQAQMLGRQLARPFILAGGLTAENVSEAIGLLRPGGVDVSGGVETGGAKDPEKIRRFIACAKAAGGGDGKC